MTDGSFPRDEDAAVAWAERIQAVLHMRATGAPWSECGAAVGWTTGHCIKMVREHAERVRAMNHRLVQQRYVEHDARLEWLYETVARRIHALATLPDGPVVDEKLVRAAVSVLERQARLHGLDVVKATGGRGRNDWLDDQKPIAEVLREAEELGLPIPDEFKTVAGV